MIKLNRLVSLNLGVTYSRKIDEKKVKHYYISASDLISKNKNPDEIVIEYVKNETNKSVEINPLKTYNAYGIDLFSVQKAAEVLENIPKVKKQLEQKNIKSAILKYNKKDEWWKYLLNPIAIPYNWLVNKINAKWANYQWNNFGGFPKKKTGPDGFLAFRNKIKSIPLLPIAGWHRYATVCRYLTVTFNEETRHEAIKILQDELKILADKKLIIGHLSMPFQIELADVVGADDPSYVIACFLFVDDQKIIKLVGKDNFYKENPDSKILNKLLGLKTEAQEGGLSEIDLRKKYEIETIDIFEKEREANREAYIKNWEEQQIALKRIHDRNYKLLSGNNKSEKDSNDCSENVVSNLETLCTELENEFNTLVSDKKD